MPIDAKKQELIASQEMLIDLWSSASESYKSEHKGEIIQARIWLGNTFSIEAKEKSGQQADDLFQRAREQFQHVIALEQDNAQAYFYLGNALSYQAQQKNEDEAETLFQQSVEKYMQSVERTPSHHDTFYNWGTTLQAWADQKLAIMHPLSYIKLAINSNVRLK